MKAFLVLGCVFGLTGVALGAFGSHAIRSRFAPERVATFETGVRYQLWHALALFAVVLMDAVRLSRPSAGPEALTVMSEGSGWPVLAAGWLFSAGIVLFSGSLYALAFTGRRALGAVTPVGGLCFLLGWAALLLAALTR